MESQHLAPFHQLASGGASDAKKRTRGRFTCGGADGVAPRLCETGGEGRTTPGTQVVRGPLWLATRGRNHDVSSVCTARDGRRSADTGEITRQVVDTSHVGEIELSADVEAFCVYGRRNSALREHIVTDGAASRNQPRGPTTARAIPIAAGCEERRHADPQQWLPPEASSLEHDSAYFVSVPRAIRHEGPKRGTGVIGKGHARKSVVVSRRSRPCAGHRMRRNRAADGGRQSDDARRRSQAQ